MTTVAKFEKYIITEHNGKFYLNGKEISELETIKILAGQLNFAQRRTETVKF
jgi:hypothetical protein